jgi:outer membrane lipase/esterase
MVDLLQAAGAQHIIVWNAPNLGLTPALRGVPSAFTGSGLSGTQIGSLIGGNFNGALQSRLAGEAGVQIFDLYGIAARAASPGFTNTSDACGVTNTICATSLFWDGIHPTTAAHGAIAAEMFALAAPVPEPTTVAMMLAGLLVIARVARRRATGSAA